MEGFAAKSTPHPSHVLSLLWKSLARVYDQVFREHVVAICLTDWLCMNVQLFNFHAAGSSVREFTHYLDDFLTAGPAHSNQCAYNLQTALAVCRSLGLPLHTGKCIGSSTCLTVLGIELDSVQQVASLPGG